MLRRTWLAGFSLGGSLVLAQKRPIRITVITGGHPHPASFYELFRDSSFAVTINPHPSAYQQDLRERCDVLVLYDMVFEMADEKKRNELQRFCESGRGVLVLHHAFCNYQDWPWYQEQLVGGGYLTKARADLKLSQYHLNQTFQVEQKENHPVLAGLGQKITFKDELYQDCWHTKTNRVLLATDHPNTDGPMVWQSAYQRSKVLVNLMGHDQTTHLDPNYQLLIKNSLVWLAD
jgi:type 1 glutamine amidotransferase